MSNEPESPGDDSASRKRRKVEEEADESTTQVGEASEPPKTDEPPSSEDKEPATPDQENNNSTDDPAATTTNPTTDEANETSKDETMQDADETEKPSDPTPPAPTNPEESIPPAQKESSHPYDSLRWTIVKNDGRPESLIKLIALKSLFAKQLPKMPRAYIARLVFDLRHISLVILSQDPALKDTDEEVIGSICYRPFPEMRFAEIAFCAVNATHQVKGYGTKLMNLVKKEGARTGIEYFITYADNYAIGYFKKQGFSKTVTMPKGRYQGLIKDYDGGTMMECYVHPSIDFTRIPEMLQAQRRFILQQISLKANSTRVYDPLPNGFSPNLEGVSRANEAAARAMAIPGMVEAGWTMADILAATGQGKDVDRAKSALRNEMLQIVRKVEEQQFAWPFREPVDTNEVKDYLDVIKEPIDLSTIDKRIRKGDHYKSKQMLYADLILMVNNCKLYNDEASTYVQCAISLEKFLGSLFVN